MKAQRLGKENYEEIIGLMNAVFSRKNGREMDFERDLPKMCVRDDEHMRKHFGIFDGGKLVACLGVYPFETVVAGEKLLFATMGNIVTHWDFEGKGYMNELLGVGVRELADLNVDAARLGGLRSRYNRYGFEMCGQKYGFSFTAKNRERKLPDRGNGIEFAVVEKSDAETLSFCANLYNKNEIAVTRTAENAYVIMTAWRNIPYIAAAKGKTVGYLCANEDGMQIAECFAENENAYVDMICAWQKRVGDTVYFSLQPQRIKELRIFSEVCESGYAESPSRFCIRNWEKVVGAFMRLKAGYCELIPGELAIGIKDYGAIRLFSGCGGVGCEKTDKSPDISLDCLSAARYIFGPYPPYVTAKAGPEAQSWFPLPLGWNGQDRV